MNLPGIVDVKQRPRRKDFFKLTDSPQRDLIALAADTRMPIEYITDKYRHKRRGSNPGMGQAFPSPSKHIDMMSGWNTKFNVTVSAFNDGHHVSQREYFDRPIVVP